MEQCRGLVGELALGHSTAISAAMSLSLFVDNHRRRSPNGFEGCLLPDGWEPSRLDKRGTPGWGSPYANEPLSSVSGCRQGSSDRLAKYQTKDGQCMSNFEKPSLVSGRTIRHVQTLRGVPIVQCSVSKTGNPYLISHYNVLIVVRPGGGFSLLLPESTRGKVPMKDSGNAWAPVEQV